MEEPKKNNLQKAEELLRNAEESLTGKAFKHLDAGLWEDIRSIQTAKLLVSAALAGEDITEIL